MLSQEHIPIGKVKQAFGLTAQDVQTLLHTLQPKEILPAALWQKAYSSFWRGKISTYRTLYKLDTPPYPERLQFLSFPEIRADPADPDRHYYFEKSCECMVVLFIEISSVLLSDKVKAGLDYIMEETYEEYDDIFVQERKALFEKLTMEDKEFAIRFATCANAKDFIITIDDKRHAVSLSYFSFLSQIFYDTIVVDKIASIRYLLKCGYYLQREVKGISRALVERIAATLDDHPQKNSPAPPSTSSIVVPRALWNGKTPQAARDAMAAEDIPQNIIAHILYTRCKITNKSYIASLLDTYPKKVTAFLAETAVMDIADS